jgi:uncharacterized protein (DUF58 family)
MKGIKMNNSFFETIKDIFAGILSLIVLVGIIVSGYYFGIIFLILGIVGIVLLFLYMVIRSVLDRDVEEKNDRMFNPFD